MLLAFTPSRKHIFLILHFKLEGLALLLSDLLSSSILQLSINHHLFIRPLCIIHRQPSNINSVEYKKLEGIIQCRYVIAMTPSYHFFINDLES